VAVLYKEETKGDTMIKNTERWFHVGKGDVSASVAKSDSDILHEEAELLATEAEGVSGQEGGAGNDNGAKPIHATGSAPFHQGRGLGRGHGPETK
jgi:hypothetical protein